jgi:putative transposase
MPKYRRRILNPGVLGYLRKLFPKVVMSMPGCEIVNLIMKDDHIHMVMIIPSRYVVGEVVGKLKGMTASELRKMFSWLGKVYWKENVVWSPGYFVSTVGIDEGRVLKYLKWQEVQDLGQAKFEF